MTGIAPIVDDHDWHGGDLIFPREGSTKHKRAKGREHRTSPLAEGATG